MKIDNFFNNIDNNNNNYNNKYMVYIMILKIQNFCEKNTLILNLINHTGWMGSIDLLISRQNPSIETTTSG